MFNLGRWSEIQAQILDRVKSDRIPSSKPEEDRRRRTIIVEKKNGSFGFTLQSYGIHYKKEQEIEMITYVDYVDYDGAAFKAGMREGDVILSINGHDMEKADHKTLVNFIKNCDSRMRMVVLFEDCVRKVELHMRYIQLQRVLQGKMVELERLCLRERELLQGKWKTHSLPARKKTTAAAPNTSAPLDDHCEYSYCRSTMSTEDVARVQQSQQSQVMFAYQYLEPGYYSLQRPADNVTSKFLKTWTGQETPGHIPHHSQNTEEVCHSTNHCDCSSRQNSGKGYHETNGVNTSSNGSKSSKSRNRQDVGQSHSTSNSLCSPCVQASQDSSSLEAYDLASPCCDPHCVPSARRRSRANKESRNVHGNRSSKNGSESRGWKEKGGRNGQSVCSQTENCQFASHASQTSNPKVHRYINFGAGLVSQCSLHSCTSSDLSCTAPGGPGCESSAASYSTSLSTDTLYWDPAQEMSCRNNVAKVSTSKPCDMYPDHLYHSASHQASSFTSYTATKPAKSWDNLTTKAFGGYGFGYGYLDTSSSKSCMKGNHYRTQSTKVNGSGRNTEQKPPGNSGGNGGFHNHLYQAQYMQPNKSTESLLLLPKYSGDPTQSDSSLSCDCLDSALVDGNMKVSTFFPSSMLEVNSSCDTYHSVQPQQQQQSQQQQQQKQHELQFHQSQQVTNQPHVSKASQTDTKGSASDKGGEITRL